jgi:hypothetical protein
MVHPAFELLLNAGDVHRRPIPTGKQQNVAMRTTDASWNHFGFGGGG